VIAGLGIIIAVILALSSCGSAGTSGSANPKSGSSTASATPIRLAIANVGSQLNVVVAKKQGFFKKHDLNVKTTVLADIGKIPPALGKQFDIGVGIQPSFLLAASHGIPIVQISGGTLSSKKNPQELVMVRKNSKIEDPTDLAGKRIGTPVPTGNINTAVRYWLLQHGVNLDSVQSVQVPSPSMIDQIRTGKIDAGEVIQPFVAEAEAKGLRPVGYGMAAVDDPVGFTAWIAARSWASTHHKAILNFRAALDEADQWIAKHTARAKKIEADFTGVNLKTVQKAGLITFSTSNRVHDLAVCMKPLTTVRGIKFPASFNVNKLVMYPTK
jgi:NitT/TauT family transport system substrate-binding protein